MSEIKEAFDKVKEDIFYLSQEISNLKQQLEETVYVLTQTREELEQLRLQGIVKESLVIPEIQEIVRTPTQNAQNSTDNQHPTHVPAHNPTHLPHLEAVESQFYDVSTGNRGVPTDKPTNQQTHQQTDIPAQNPLEIRSEAPIFSQNQDSNRQTNKPTDTPTHVQPIQLSQTHSTITQKADYFEKAREILDSLDSIKKEIRLKFKRLTGQEMQVFSTLYTLEEQGISPITYKILAQHLNLSESSIRDYINKISSKGITIQKLKENNKTVILRVSQDLKKIANLSTIIQLREL